MYREHAHLILTPRVSEAVGLLARGFNAKEISAQMGVCTNRVYELFGVARQRLGITSQHGLIRWAIENQMVMKEPMTTAGIIANIESMLSLLKERLHHADGRSV